MLFLCVTDVLLEQAAPLVSTLREEQGETSTTVSVTVHSEIGVCGVHVYLCAFVCVCVSFGQIMRILKQYVIIHSQ